MDEYNKQIEYNNKSINSNITKSYIIYTIIAGILTLIPISSLLFNLVQLIYPSIYISESIYVAIFYITKLIGFSIYVFVLRKNTKKGSLLIVIASILLLLSFLAYDSINNMDNKGLDYIGQALGMAIIYRICIYIYYVLTFILFIIYSRSFIFKKKVLIPIIISMALFSLFIYGYNKYTHYASTQKITNEIPSVNEFKNKLVERNLYVDDYILFGVDNIDNYIHKISFNNDYMKTYSSYVYFGYKTKNISKKIEKYSDYLSWIIYYTNGKLYAVLGYLDDSQLFQHFYKLTLNNHGNILSEDKEIYVYNWKNNYYDKIDIEKYGVALNGLRYNYEDETYIFVDVFEKFTKVFHQYEIIDRINSSTLDNYANSLEI